MSAVTPSAVIVNPKLASAVPLDDLPRYVRSVTGLLQQCEIALGALTARLPETWRQGDHPHHADALLTPEDVAKLLHVDVRAVHAMCRTKQLPGFKLGKLWRLNRRDFERWQQDQQSSDNRAGALVGIRRVRKGSE